MASSIYASALPFIWAILLLFMVMSFFAVVIMQILTSILSSDITSRGTASKTVLDVARATATTTTTTWAPAPARLLSPEDLWGAPRLFKNTEDTTLKQTIDINYGGFLNTLMTLLLIISGGDWGHQVTPLTSLSPMFTPLFALFVCIIIFGILNVLTGIFVENAMDAILQDKEFMMADSIQAQSKLEKQLYKIFAEACALEERASTSPSKVDQNYSMSEENFQKVFKDAQYERQLAIHLRTLGLDSHQARGLFQLLDTDSSGYVTIREFVDGCMRIKGGARQVDVETLMFENKKSWDKMNKFIRYCQQQFGVLEDLLISITDDLNIDVDIEGVMASNAPDVADLGLRYLNTAG